MALRVAMCAVFARQARCARLDRGPALLREPLQANGKEAVEGSFKSPVALDPEHIRDKMSQDLLGAPAKLIDMIERDWILLQTVLLDGFSPPAQSMMVWITTLCMAILWFVFYFKVLYTSDCAWAEMPWESDVGKSEDMLTPGRPGSEPDVVICFPHPAQRQNDDDKRVDSDFLASIVTHGQTTIQRHRSFRSGDESSGTSSVAFWGARDDRSPTPGPTPTAAGHAEFDMATARQIVLKELLSLLPRNGFHVEVWSSVGQCRLFVGVSLRSGKATLAYLYKYQFDLTLRRDFIKNTLRVKHPEREAASAPPSVMYDPIHVQLLSHASHIKAAEGIYQTYSDQGTKGTLANSRVRVLAIQQELSDCMDIQAALSMGFVSEFYPAHNPAWTQMLRAQLASKKGLVQLMQPLPVLREYFGERLAFDHAWTGTYCKAIVPLALFSIAIFLVRRASWALGLHIFHDRQVISGSIVILLWGAVAHNLWIREKLFFIELWDLQEGDSREKTSRKKFTRPEFIGDEGPSIADQRVDDLHFPKSWWLKLETRKLIAFFITMQLCVCVATYVLTLVEARRGDFSLLDSAMLCGFIKVSELLFNLLAAPLTQWENHKYQNDFYNSIAVKTFMFQFVNYYWWFVCLCFYQKLKGFCPAMGCFETLQQQLRRVVLFNLAYSAGEQAAHHLFVKLQCWWASRGRRGGSRGSDSVTGAEEQSRYVTVGTREHIDSMMQRVMALGYIIFFGAIEPLIVPAIWLMFVVHLRMESWLLTTSKQRPWPTTATGLGAWEDATEFMLRVSTIFSVCIVVTYGELFSGASTIARVTFVILWMMGVYTMRGLVNVMLPGKKQATTTLAARKAATKQKLFELVRKQVHGEDLEDIMTPVHAGGAEEKDISENVQRAQNGRWSEITTRTYQRMP